MSLSARDPKTFICNSPEIGRLLGISDRQVRNLVAAGMPRMPNNRYDAAECVQWRITQLLLEGEETDGMSPRDALAIAQRVRVELETEQLRGTLLPRELVERACNGVAALVASQLDSLGPRLAGELADISDPQQIQATLFREARATSCGSGSFAGISERNTHGSSVFANASTT